MEEDNIELKFDDEAVKLIAEKAIERKTGARGLRGIIEDTLEDIMFYLPDSEEKREVLINTDTLKTKEAEIKFIEKGDVV